ncbi:hypothetical protein GCM10023350_29230 [Nocardioides endophyticus]|uniref:Uncharacterized protein n=1 Tax=Nocardioides endophyticus TaxID=1353775 RepID=A0ABP8YZ72_9ACTN
MRSRGESGSANSESLSEVKGASKSALPRHAVMLLGASTPWVATLGDSSISGETGRRAGSSGGGGDSFKPGLDFELTARR